MTSIDQPNDHLHDLEESEQLFFNFMSHFPPNLYFAPIQDDPLDQASIRYYKHTKTPSLNAKFENKRKRRKLNSDQDNQDESVSQNKINFKKTNLSQSKTTVNDIPKPMETGDSSSDDDDGFEFSRLAVSENDAIHSNKTKRNNLQLKLANAVAQNEKALHSQNSKRLIEDAQWDAVMKKSQGQKVDSVQVLKAKIKSKEKKKKKSQAVWNERMKKLETQMEQKAKKRQENLKNRRKNSKGGKKSSTKKKFKR